jgi:membrane-associated protein
VTGLYALEVGSALSYVMAVLVPALDALVPVLPSETVVIALGVATAGSADPRIGLLVALAAFGAFLGDNVAYLVGRRFGPAVDRRLFAGERGARRRCWAQRSLDRFGIRIIIACRFIPGGRTAVTLTCGLIGYPWRRFAAATACAGMVWASYAFFLGRLGGKVFEHQPWIGLLLALGLAVAVSVLIEAARRAWRWHANARHRTRQAPSAGQQLQVGLQAAWEDPLAADGLSLADAGPMTARGDHDTKSPYEHHRGYRAGPGPGPRRGTVPDLREGPKSPPAVL